tara:strand:- start:2593 stop:4002 length:1410 start_codon:yes stop_codon:yes gene_type:complete
MSIQFLSGVNITGTTSVSVINNDDATYTGILVWDGGLLKYRTKAQILSDIGATGNTGTVTSVSLGTLNGISGSVTNSTTAASIALTNTDKGSSQSIFKTISSSGQPSITASSNTDTLKFAGNNATTVSTNASTNTITISSTDNNTNYYVTGISFATGTGVLSLTRNGLTTLTVDLDGRYATSSGVTSVSGTGSVSGLTLSGTVTSTGSLTLGGTLSLTSGNVTTALGFTPYNATNPSGFTNVTNNNQITNGSGYTTNTGTTTASNTQTFTNKSGNISQWSNNVPYLTSSQQSLPVFSMLTCSTTTITTNTDGVANAVVMKFDTEAVTFGTSTDIVVYGSSGISGVEDSQYVWELAKKEVTRYFEFQWNVTSNTNTVNNRILSGIRLQHGTIDRDGVLQFATLDPTHSYIYDRGTGSVRKGSTAGSILIRVTGSDNATYYRMQFWRESGTSGVKSESVLNGTQWTIKQLN